MKNYKTVLIIASMAVVALFLGLFLGVGFKVSKLREKNNVESIRTQAEETGKEITTSTVEKGVESISVNEEARESVGQNSKMTGDVSEHIGIVPDSVAQNSFEVSSIEQEAGSLVAAEEVGHSDGDFVNTTSTLYTYEQMMADLDMMATAYPTLLTVRTCGTSLDGRVIPEAVLGNQESEKHIFIQASIHAREYINTLVAMRQIEQLLVHHSDGIYVDATYDEFLSQVCFHILPMSNPDGVTISQFGIEGIRDEGLREILSSCYQNDLDNGRTSSDMASYFRTWKANARGVDLNRNFDAGWETYEGVSYPSADHYKGTSPESEPETQAIVNAVHSCQAILTISYHSTGSVIYWDYGSTGDVYEKDAALANIAQVLTGYNTVSSVQSSQDAAGCSDYFVLREGVPSITIENGYSACPIGIEEFPSIWESNQTLLPALAYNYR